MGLRLQNIKERWRWVSLGVDIAMLVLVLLDLAWMMFDALFEMDYARQTLHHLFPSFTEFYEQVIHHNFLFYDGFVVLVFMIEFGVRWGVAIYQRTHSRWFFYPIAHWYDVLGFIPNGSLRMLRLLRVGGMVYRLHRWGAIDITNYYLYKVAAKYINIAVEEISDRVAIKILEETKTEIKRGVPLPDQIIDQVIRPKRDRLVQLATERIQERLQHYYHTYRKPIHDYIERTVRQAVEQNREVRNLEKIPVVGALMQESLRTAVCDIVFGVFDRLLRDFADAKQSAILQTIAEGVWEVLLAHEESPSLTSEIVIQSIELIIKRVEVKHWQENFHQPPPE